MQHSRGLLKVMRVLVLAIFLATPVAVAIQAAGGAAAGTVAPSAPAAAATPANADGAVGAISDETILFGYDIFRSGGEPIADGPVDELYILSVGDEVVISIWGALVEKMVLTVTDEGVLDLPGDGGLLVKKAGEAFKPEIPAGSIVVVTAKPIVEAKGR